MNNQNKNYTLLPAFASCPKCGKTITRIGIYKAKSVLVGFTGGSCAFCGFRAKVNLESIDKIPEKQIKKKYKE